MAGIASPFSNFSLPNSVDATSFAKRQQELFDLYQAGKNAKPFTKVGATGTTMGTVPGSTSTSPSIVSPVTSPQFTPVDLPAVPTNNPDWIKSMTEMVNQLNQQAQQKANEGRIPGGAGLEGQSSANIGSALKGGLPADVVYQLGQRAAERGVGTGNPYGASTNADYLKSIGLNSLQMMNTGQDWLSAALGRNPAAPIFDPSKLIITPLQEAGFGLERANLSLNQMKLKSDIDNSNAQRQLQSDLANASNQQEREKLLWQYEQNRLQREQNLKIAEMEMARRGSGYGYGGGGGGGNFGGGGNTQTATPTPSGVSPYAPKPWIPTTAPPPNIPNYPGSNDVVMPGNNYDPNFQPPLPDYGEYNPFPGLGLDELYG